MADQIQYNPNQDDITLRDNFTISMAKLKKIFKFQYLIHLLLQPDSLTGNADSNKNKGLLKNIIKGTGAGAAGSISHKDKD